MGRVSDWLSEQWLGNVFKGLRQETSDVLSRLGRGIQEVGCTCDIDGT